MVYDNETIKDIVGDMRTVADKADSSCSGYVETSYIRCYADRIENVFAEYAKINEKQDVDNSKLKAEDAKLRALVGELADVALSGSLDIIDNVAEYIEVDCGTMSRVEAYREILAKARETIGGAK